MRRHNHFFLFFLPALLFACGDQLEERDPGESEFDCSEEGACPSAEKGDGPSESGLEGKITLEGSESYLKHTHLTVIGNESNITRVYFVVHGDGNSDYAESTASDRQAMANHLEPGEGALVAYPVSKSSNWPGFDGGKNGDVLLKMFRQLEKLVGNNNLRFEQFALSGGGRVNHALLRLINDNYNSDEDVREFVDNHLRGIHDGDSLCYSIDSMRESYIKAIQSFGQINFCFIHNTSGYMSYVQKHHNTIAKTISGQSYSYGGSLSLENGRLRFWAAATHWTAWHTQFERVFFGDGAITPPPVFIGASCDSNESCSTGACLTASFPDGMCTQSCTGHCPDKSGEPITICITFDPATNRFEGDQGQCFSQCDTSIYSENGGCRSGYTCVEKARHNQSSTKRTVCIPEDLSD